MYYETIIKLEHLKERRKLLIIKNELAARNDHKAYSRFEKEQSHAARVELELRHREQDAAADSLLATNADIEELRLLLKRISKTEIEHHKDQMENLLKEIVEKPVCLKKTYRKCNIA